MRGPVPAAACRVSAISGNPRHPVRNACSHRGLTFQADSAQLAPHATAPEGIAPPGAVLCARSRFTLRQMPEPRLAEVAQLAGELGAGGLGDDVKRRPALVGAYPAPAVGTLKAHAAADLDLRLAAGKG